MKAALRVGIGLGLVALVIWLRGGVSDILDVLNDTPWFAVPTTSAFHMIPVIMCGIAWWVLLVPSSAGRSVLFATARWIRDAVNQLLPFMPLGGEVVGSRVLANSGITGSMAAGLTVVDVTAEVVSQALFSLIGVAMWLFRDSRDGILGWALIGAALTLPMVIGLILAQRLGLVRLLERLAGKVMPDAWRSGDTRLSIHDAIVAIYQNRGRFVAACTIHLAAWIIATGEAWIALRFIGAPISFGDALALESVIYAVRAAAFLVPSGLGVQEGTYALVGAALGLPPDAALALAVMKRGRELLCGLPALLTWQALGYRSDAARADHAGEGTGRIPHPHESAE